ncbi:MAG: ParA family protein [Actinobacteria bacterium]|nr:ParA family protein [Actinomycetota bacterium]
MSEDIELKGLDFTLTGLNSNVSNPARVIAVVNQKGGVGKTTSTINLGAALGAEGKRVLLVDFDPQGALSVGLGIHIADNRPTLFQLIMAEQDIDFDDVVIKNVSTNLDLLPCDINLAKAEMLLVSEVGREQRLAAVLAPHLGKYDFVLIDCQPSLGLLTVNALAAANGVIIPVECEYFALRGVKLLVDSIKIVQGRVNPKLQIDGVLATMYDPRTYHQKEVLARIKDAFKGQLFKTPITRTIKFPDAQVQGRPLIEIEPKHSGATQYQSVARELLARLA